MTAFRTEELKLIPVVFPIHPGFQFVSGEQSEKRMLKDQEAVSVKFIQSRVYDRSLKLV